MAIDDTLAGGVYHARRVRASRWLPHAATATGTASATINVGLRKRSDLTVLSATAIASSDRHHDRDDHPDQWPPSNGAYRGAGVCCDQVLTDDAEVYVTAKGAVLAANQLAAHRSRLHRLLTSHYPLQP
jgi:hypothetical protein